jgi:prepilin-type N-terminal cleavage/methylation domain-containing protein/prepilin-type processing-associated H-X9-DG protein
LRSCRFRGFTLIELLVVIAIIGILAAMLFPVFARARESARKIQCLANVKNIAMAMNMYFSDYDRFPPNEHDQAAIDYFTTGPGGDWAPAPDGTCARVAFANPYLRWPVILDEYIKNRDVWKCSSATRNSGAGWIIGAPNGNWLGWLKANEGKWGRNQSDPDCAGGPCCVAWPSGWGGAVTDSITQRMTASDDPGAFAESIGTASHPATQLSVGVGPHNCDMSISQIEDPAWFVVCGDANWNDIEYPASVAFPEACGIGFCGTCCELGCYHPDFWENTELRKEYTRHMGGSNIGFADGHAKWFSAEAVINECPTAADLSNGHMRGIGTTVHAPLWNWDNGCP